MKDEVICDVVPLDVCDILFWQPIHVLKICSIFYKAKGNLTQARER